MADFNFDELGSKTKTDPKIISILSYVTFIGWIVAVVMNNPRTRLASFHIRQSLGIMLLGVAAGMATMVPFTGELISRAGSILTFVLWIVGFIGALQGEERPVPFLGEKFQEWFESL